LVVEIACSWAVWVVGPSGLGAIALYVVPCRLESWWVLGVL
jgi:hypothetical protein